MDTPVVSVVMITYNHEKYIRQAIESVLMQVCDFSIELILCNDRSTDQTDEIVKDIIENHKNGKWIKYYNHDKNIGMMPNFLFALSKAKGKYVALCDGDDYWLTNNKLKKQVMFLESNFDVVGCFHNAYLLVDSNMDGLYYADKNTGMISFNEAILKGGGLYPTASILYRNIIQLPMFNAKIRAGDTCLLYTLLEEGNLYYCYEVDSIYRKHENGIYSGIKNNKKLIIEDAKSNFYIIYQYIKTTAKFKIEYNEAIQQQLQRLSNRFRWNVVFKLVLSKNIRMKDFFIFYFLKLYK